MVEYTLRFIKEPKDLGYFLEKKGFMPLNEDFNPLLREYINKDQSISIKYMLSKGNYNKSILKWKTIEECSFWSKLKINSDKPKKSKKLIKKLLKNYKKILDINKYWKKLGNTGEDLANSIDKDYERRKQEKRKGKYEGDILTAMQDLVEGIKNNEIEGLRRHKYLNELFENILPNIVIDDSFVSEVFYIRDPLTGKLNYKLCKRHFNDFVDHVQSQNWSKQIPGQHPTKPGVFGYDRDNLAEYLFNEIFSKRLNLTVEEMKKVWENLRIRYDN